MNKVYLINNLCDGKIGFEKALKNFLPFAEKGTAEMWAMSVWGNPSYIFCPSPALGTLVQFCWHSVWIHVWDDSPFSGEMFQKKLGMCNPKKNFFVLYGHTNGYSEGFLDKLIQSRFGGIYPDVEKRNRHVFIVYPDTNEGMNKLVEEVRKAMI